MDAKDLMVGDWVQVPCLIDEVENFIGYCKVKQLRDCDLDVIGFKELKYKEIVPIPLTPEILEKNGFTWHDEPLVQYWTGYGLIIDQSGSLFYIRTLSTSIIFHSVHELQHLLKMFNINKDIEL